MATPEPRDRMIRRSGTGEAMPEMARGRGSYLDLLWEVVVNSEARSDFQFQAMRGRGQFRPEGKENIPPGRSASTIRRRSALPVWYPRTPLRDVTAIVNALERRRTALRLAARQRRQSGQITSSPSLDDSPLAHSTRLTHRPQTTCGEESSSSPLIPLVSITDGESSPRTPFIASQDNSKLLELEMKLEKSIEVIEKAVKENMKRTPKVRKDAQRERLRSLRSMR
ncbi:protein POLYCHOME-like [Wolffia australiana]